MNWSRSQERPKFMVQQWKPAWLVLVAVSCAFSQSSAWINKAPMPTDRDSFGVGVVNGVIYVIGGLAPAGAAPTLNTVESYDPVTDRWATKSSTAYRTVQPCGGSIERCDLCRWR